MLLKRIVHEDLANYCKPDMLIGFPNCTFKCDLECHKKVCQNSELSKSPNIDMQPEEIVNRYLSNNLTTSIVFGGLEPMDTFDDMVKLIACFRKYTNDDIVIYTGYREDEIESKLSCLKNYDNIIVKFGRFIPGQKGHIDPILNVELASQNQYAKRIS